MYEPEQMNFLFGRIEVPKNMTLIIYENIFEKYHHADKSK